MLYSQSDANIWFNSVIGEQNFYISLPIYVSTDSEIALAQFIVEYDSSVIVPLSRIGQIGSGATGFSIANTNNNLPFPPNAVGTNKNLLIQISGGGSGVFSGDSLEVFIIDFLVTGAYKTESKISFDQTEGHTFLSTANLNDIQGESINFFHGNVTVDDFSSPAEFDLRSPADSSWSNEGLPILFWDASSDAASGLAFYQLFINSNLNVNNIPLTQTSSVPSQELNDGEYFWNVVAIDSAGNARESNAVWMLRLDLTPPISEITNLNSGQQVTGTYIVEGTANDGSGIGIDTVMISIDNGVTWAGVTRIQVDFSTWKYDWNVSQDGPITLLTKAIDKLGNEESPQGITVTDLEQTELSTIPTEFTLSQNYPNPFNPETIIEFQIPNRSHVTIRIYNLVGQEIVILANEVKDIGHFKIVWDGKDSFGTIVTSGVYIYQMRAGDFVTSRKLILLR